MGCFPFLWGQFSELWQLMTWLLSGQHAVNCPTWGFTVYKTALQEMNQNIICGPWEWTEGLWLCLMTKLLFGLLWLFFFVSASSHFSDSLAKVFPQTKVRLRTWGQDHGALLCSANTLLAKMLLNNLNLQLLECLLSSFSEISGKT